MGSISKVEQRHHVSACTGKGFTVRKGDLIRVTDLKGQQPVDFWALNRANIHIEVGR